MLLVFRLNLYMCIRRMCGAYGLCVIFILFLGRGGCVIFTQISSLLAKETDNITIQCSHNDNDLPMMLWYQQKSDSPTMVLIGYTYGTNQPNYEDAFKYNRFTLKSQSTLEGDLIISRVLQSDSAVYYCAAKRQGYEAYFGSGTKLTVLDPLVNITKPTVKILKPSENEECEKTRVTLVCLATGFYPDHVQMSWRINGMKQMNGVATDNAASYSNTTGEMPSYTISSRLSITHQEWHDGLHYKCVVSFYNGKKTSIHSDSINGPQGPKVKYLKTSRLTMLAYGAFIGKSVVYGLFILFIIKRQGLMCK